jgi:Cellulase (glycosyl hydrolase family 5)
VASAPVATAPTNTALPQVSGTAQAGQTLTASTGTWTGSPTPSYARQWKRCDGAGANCVAITGATASTFALTTTDVGSTLRVSVTATNGAGSATATSAQTAVVAAASTGDVYSRPVPRYGISPSFSILQDSPTDRAWEVARWVDLGAKIIRLDYVTGTSWATVADSVISQTLAAGLEPELCMGCNIHYPWSKTASQYGADCSSVATKYHGKVRYYEVMNEPNGAWNGPWDPTVYFSYLKACYQAVKAVDSRNQVLLGGIAPAPAPGIDAVPWVQKLYAAGAKGYFDVMNMHNYGETDPYLKATWSMWCKTFGCGGVVPTSVVDVMAQYGDSAKPIVSTEGGVNSDSVGETQQATTVDHYLRYPDPRFKTAYVYCVWCGTGFSVTRPDKSYKPAYTTYKTDAHS